MDRRKLKNTGGLVLGPTGSSPAEWLSYVFSTKGRAEPQGQGQTIRSRGT